MADPRAWLHGDESAKEMLSRALSARPVLLLPPPLHRVPVRAGNVVEIAGPSPSAKSQALLQAAVQCILPVEWKGVHLGGLGKIAMYFDLDCRFDVLRLSQILKHRIMEAFRLAHQVNNGCQNADEVQWDGSFHDELFFDCMKRFLYARCYSSFEFLAALRTICCQSQRKSSSLGVGVHFLMIDSIGAFYWIDLACQPIGDHKRKHLSLQGLAESIVHEIRKLLQLHPALVLTTKATLYGAESSTYEVQRASRKWSSEASVDFRILNQEGERNLTFREYMPLTWQSFVTHRIQLQALGEVACDNENETFPIFTSQWVKPPLSANDKFVVRNDGVFLIP